jgi:UDP-N-acetylglucosamine--N-acetylmuramyl-(pentapeptide) pyrophosphoryl-undecaprenol N-acetylglucosamine transferase
VLNQTLPAALALIPEADRPQVLHQTGAAQLDAVRTAYAAAGISADVRPFIDDMAQQLATCDVIVCRAGAVTGSELCAAGVPSLLVPLVVSTTAHQRDNAKHMADHGAALHIDQKTLTPASLASHLQALTRPALLVMAEQARALARPHAAARVADELDKLVHKP